MASCITSHWGNSYSPQIKLTSVVYSSTDTTLTHQWTLYYIASHAASTSSSRKYTVKINGETVKTGTYDIDGKTGTKKIASGKVTFDRTHSSETIKIYCSMAFNLTWSGTYAGTKSASDTFSMAPKTSYTITYNTNGGSGQPASQTKWHGETLTLQTTVPTKTGHTFLGWSTSSSATSAAYAAGATVATSALNANTTLYAVWRIISYTITYNGNEGTLGSVTSQTKNYGSAVTLTGTATRTDYNFLGWSTSSSATTAAYTTGSSYTSNASITLYAVWEVAYVKPRITGLSISRADEVAAETTDEEGNVVATAIADVNVSFNWATDEAISSITIVGVGRDKDGNTLTATNNLSVTSGATSGTVTNANISANFGAEYSVDVTITVTDAGGYNTANGTANGTNYLLDFMYGGDGVAIGKVASRGSKSLEIGFTAYDKFDTLMGNGLAFYKGTSTECQDPDTTIEPLILTNVNTPMGSGYFMYIHTDFYITKSATANRAQVAIPYGNIGSVYHRYYVNGTWSSWRRHVNEDEFVHYTASGVKAATYAASTTLATMTVPAGAYIVIGSVACNVGSSTCMNVAVGFSNGSWGGPGVRGVRTTQNSGGGATTSGYVFTSTGGTISISSYGYYNATYNFDALLQAIKLPRTI